MNKDLFAIKTKVYDLLNFNFSDFREEEESKAYAACRFTLNNFLVINRNGKTTPKKDGHFVTFWKRNKEGVTQAFNENDAIDFYTVIVENENQFGQFVFPKSILIKKGIISTYKNKGKMGFRVCPSWCAVNSKQAIQTQKWQLDYFYKINQEIDLDRVKMLFCN
mgnify:CR=1 FL=1